MERITLILMMWMISFSLIVLILLLVAFKQIKMKWAVLLGKRRDKGLVVEIKTNRSIREHFVKFTKDTMKLGKDPERNYNVKPEHVFMSDDWGCKAVVVSEALKSSINPSSKEGVQGMDNDTMTALIKRAKSAGQQEALDFIQKMTKMIPLFLMGMGLAFAIIIGMLIKILLALQGGKIL